MAKKLQWPYHPLPGKQTVMWEAMGPQSTKKFIGYGGGRGSGKAAPFSSKIMTPFGWRTMGDMKVGSLISAPDGSTQKVIQVHPQGDQDIYKVRFDSGATTYCTLDHLWKCTISNQSYRDGKTRWRIMTTGQLIEQFERNKTNKAPKYPLVPLSKPVKYQKSYKSNMRPIDPYLLGLTLGDGCITGTTKPSITTADQEIVDSIVSICEGQGWEYSVYDKGNKFQVSIRDDRFRQHLKKLKLYGTKSATKFIPDPYLWNNVEDRWLLLQGLMDTDGHVDKEGHLEYITISEKLGKDFTTLVRSLGAKAYLRTKDSSYAQQNGQRVLCPVAYRISFNIKNSPKCVRLSRKKERTREEFNGGVSELKHRMVSIEFSHREEAQCITVGNPDRTYICDDFIVTHNSHGMRSWFVTGCWKWPIKAVIIRKSRADLRDNHINPFKAEMKEYIDAGYIKFNERDAAAYFQNGSILKFDYCNKPEDLEHIQGQAYDLMGIEESTQLDALYLRKMFAACRGSEISDGTYQNKVLMTFNWGAVSHNYHRRIFWDKEYNEFERPEKYQFIWANIDDNPALLAKTPDYKEQLAATLDEQYRRAWIEGDPDAFTGTVFSITDIAHIVDPSNTNILGKHGGIVPNTWKIFGSIDVGTTVCAFGLYCKTPGGNIFKMFSYYGEDKNPQDHIESIVDRIRNFRWTDGRFPSYVLADRRAFAKIGSNQIHSYDTTWQDLLRPYGIYLKRANDNREQGFMALKGAFGYKYDDEKHEIITHPKLRFFRGTNKTTIDHLKAMRLAANTFEDIDQNLPDHDYDETRYAYMGALTPREKKEYIPKDKTDPNRDYGRNRENNDLISNDLGLNGAPSVKSNWDNWFS